MQQEQTPVDGDAVVLQTGKGFIYRRGGEKKKVGIIGAGPAGLAALRRLSEAGLDVICLEQGATLGGIWNYTEATGRDENGVPRHAFIYRDLRTNLPKETMMFPEYPYPELPESYIHWTEVVNYLKNFASHYDLQKYIKYCHRVTALTPLSSCWSLTAFDSVSKQERIYVLDSVFVCSGPFATPVYPEGIEMAKFRGQQIHSKEYRVPEPYKDKTVLLIGLGPSGLDITYQLSPFAKQIYLSSNRGIVRLVVPDNVTIKPEVKNLEDLTANFKDGSSEHIDCIIYCTGYTFNYPFLDKESGVTVNKFVFPLYKHFISIERPNLFFIGLPRPISHLFMCDFQVRAAVRYLQGEIEFPSKEEMTEEWKNDIQKREESGQKKHNFHQVGKCVEQYFNELSDLGKFERIPPVQISMFSTAHKNSIMDFGNFRKYVYRIINDKDFDIEKVNDA